MKNEQKVTISGAGNNCLINSFIVYMIAHIRSTEVNQVRGLDIFEEGPKGEAASKYLHKLTCILQVYMEDLSTDTVLKIINKLNIFEAQCLFASAARIYLDKNLPGDMYSKNFVGQREKLEIKAFGETQSIELIPYIAKQLEIESKNILVSDPYTSKPYYYTINDNNECEQHIEETLNRLSLFKIRFSGEHFDIILPADLYGPFVAHNDYDSLAGFRAFIEKYTAEDQINLHVITDTALHILQEKLKECTNLNTKASKPTTPGVKANPIPQAQPKAEVKPETPGVKANPIPQAQPKAEIFKENSNIPQPKLRRPRNTPLNINTHQATTKPSRQRKKQPRRRFRFLDYIWKAILSVYYYLFPSQKTSYQTFKQEAGSNELKGSHANRPSGTNTPSTKRVSNAVQKAP